MKYLLLLTLLVSCSFYESESVISVTIPESGVLIISSEYRYISIDIKKGGVYDFSFPKGEFYAITFYPYFNSRLNRYPLGGFGDSLNKDITLSPFLGIITKGCNLLNQDGYSVDQKLINSVIDKAYSEVDPWRLNQEDVLLYLGGTIPIGAITKEPIIKLPELDFVYKWTPENSLFFYWYSSIQSFIDIETGNLLHIEVFDDGHFYQFIQAK